MGSTHNGDRRRQASSFQEFSAEPNGISVALDVLSRCEAGLTSEKVYQKALKCYEILLDALEKPSCAMQLARLAKMHPRRIKACSLRVVDLLLYNRGNDPFISLGLPRNAKRDDINRRWKRLLVLFHPDKATRGMSDLKRTMQINAAYQRIDEMHPEGTAEGREVFEEDRGSVRENALFETIISFALQIGWKALEKGEKYFWRAFYMISGVKGGNGVAHSHRGDELYSLRYLPSIIVIATAFIAILMFSLYVLRFLLSFADSIIFS